MRQCFSLFNNPTAKRGYPRLVFNIIVSEVTSPISRVHRISKESEQAAELDDLDECTVIILFGPEQQPANGGQRRAICQHRQSAHRRRPLWWVHLLTTGV